jgi:hypothetical protein
LKRLFIFWLPLAVMWIIMGVEQPALNGVIARLPSAARHLAAFEVAFALALVIESPILQMLSAATALVGGRDSYRSIMRFMGGWAVVLSLIHLVVSRPVVFGAVAGSLLGVPAEVIGPARETFALMIPFSAMVGYRRLWQGALIRAGETARVARTMVLRIVVSVAILGAGLVFHRVAPDRSLDGHIVAAVALIAGVIVGAAASWWYFRTVVLPTLPEEGDTAAMTTPALLRFYMPLSLTSIMTLVSRPVLAYGIARSTQPFLSLAAWPVVQSVLFLFTSVAMSYQEAVIAQLGQDRSREALLRRFGIILGVVLTALFAVLGYTEGSRIWFGRVAGLTPELQALARPATMVLVLVPLLITERSYYSGLLVARGRTGLLGVSMGANTVTLLLLVVLLPLLTDLTGSSVAAIAFFGANLAQMAVLWAGVRSEPGVQRLADAVS